MGLLPDRQPAEESAGRKAKKWACMECHKARAALAQAARRRSFTPSGPSSHRQRRLARAIPAAAACGSAKSACRRSGRRPGSDGETIEARPQTQLSSFSRGTDSRRHRDRFRCWQGRRWLGCRSGRSPVLASLLGILRRPEGLISHVSMHHVHVYVDCCAGIKSLLSETLCIDVITA